MSERLAIFVSVLKLAPTFVSGAQLAP